jgi:predicted nucleotidyltransferase
VAEYIKKAVKGSAIKAAFIYGSYAKNTEDINSDIDVFVIGGITGRELSLALKGAKEELSREINYVLMSPQEFGKKAALKDHFVRSVMGGRKIFIVGDENDIEKIVKPGKIKTA